MKRSRVGGKIDMQRLAMGVSMPGIDPRIWVSLCVVNAVTVDGTGYFADVSIMSTATTDDDGNVVAQTETVRIAPEYAGNGFGLYVPIDVGDEVIVEWIDGDPDHGGILTKRAWSSSDPPPDVAQNNPDDVLLIAKKDVNIRIITQGQGNVVLQVDQGKVLLGNEKNTLAVARKTDTTDCGTLVFLPNAGLAPAALTYIPPGTTPVPPTLPTVNIPLSGIINSGSKNVESD